MYSRRGAPRRQPQIVVVNHHLLLADLALKDEGFGDLLPGARSRHSRRGASSAPTSRRSSSGRPGRCGRFNILLRDVVAELAAASVRVRPGITGELAIVEARLDDLRGYRSRRCRALRVGRICPRLSWTYSQELEDRSRRAWRRSWRIGGCRAQAAANCARRAQAPWRRASTPLTSVPEESGSALGGGGEQRSCRCISRRLKLRSGCAPMSKPGLVPGYSPQPRLAIGDDFSHFAESHRIRPKRVRSI